MGPDEGLHRVQRVPVPERVAAAERPPRVLILIDHLGAGGAQEFLLDLSRMDDATLFETVRRRWRAFVADHYGTVEVANVLADWSHRVVERDLEGTDLRPADFLVGKAPGASARANALLLEVAHGRAPLSAYLASFGHRASPDSTPTAGCHFQRQERQPRTGGRRAWPRPTDGRQQRPPRSSSVAGVGMIANVGVGEIVGMSVDVGADVNVGVVV